MACRAARRAAPVDGIGSSGGGQVCTVTHFDVFNGDADGICALQQLRLAQPREEAVTVTGLKRDIALLDRVAAGPGDSMTVLDLSLDRNRAALERALERGVQVDYFDHHYCGRLPRHRGLRPFIDPTPTTCTSLIVYRYTGGSHPLWAVTGAFGDSTVEPAHALCRELGLPAPAQEALRELGEAINYNAYGESLADVLLHPAELYRALHPCRLPQAFLDQAVARALMARRQADLACARAARPHAQTAAGALYVLPDAPWARRVQGEFANRLALEAPGRAHAVLREAGNGTFMVSVRAPRARPWGADALCLRYGGGGRAAAAGVDRLPQAALVDFSAAFSSAFGAHGGRGQGAGLEPT